MATLRSDQSIQVMLNKKEIIVSFFGSPKAVNLGVWGKAP